MKQHGMSNEQMRRAQMAANAHAMNGMGGAVVIPTDKEKKEAELTATFQNTLNVSAAILPHLLMVSDRDSSTIPGGEDRAERDLDTVKRALAIGQMFAAESRQMIRDRLRAEGIEE